MPVDAVRIPLWLKLAYSVWMVVWIPLYWVHNGPSNFLWLCDAANLVVWLALWTESAVLVSSQAVGVLLVQLAWIVDWGGRGLFGTHPIGGTEYMYDPGTPLWLRLLSLFHVFMPVLLIWAVRRLGYDGRGWKVQTGLACLLLPAGFFLGTVEQNLNWVYRPFGQTQTLLPPLGWLVACLLLYPLVLFFPTHLLLAKWVGKAAPQKLKDT